MTAIGESQNPPFVNRGSSQIVKRNVFLPEQFKIMINLIYFDLDENISIPPAGVQDFNLSSCEVLSFVIEG